MSEGTLSFQVLPAEFQSVIRLAEEQLGIAITPLQEISGGWSGAMLYLIRITHTDSDRVEHLILKLDKVNPKAASDELARHRDVQASSPAAFSSTHIPEIAFERVERDGSLAIFYAIAGQSLRRYRTLSSFRRQSRLEHIFSTTNDVLLKGWNSEMALKTVDHPQKLLARWLRFRLDPGQSIETFIQEICQLPPDLPGFLIKGKLLPNPLYYARHPDVWGNVRTLDTAFGLQHSDLNTNNILTKFSSQADEPDGYYLIDFAQFKKDMPLFFDQRYLEISMLIHSLSQTSFASVVDLIVQYSEHELLPGDLTPIEMAGVNSALLAGRKTFSDWVQDVHPSLSDDLWGQYWLAGAAAGLAYCHKTGTPDEMRLTGLIFGAANLKLFFELFGISMPKDAGDLSIVGQPTWERESRIHPGAVPTSNLPAPLTNFIGRAIELEEIAELVLKPETRLVTLTGPGGTGKTRLALETANVLLDAFEQGVFFIDLAGIQDPGLVLSTTAHTLGIREGGGQVPLGKLKSTLANKKMLLIFDNFEQVIDAAVELSELLTAVQGLKALVTSRIPLQLRAEIEYPVSPLAMPPERDQAPDATVSYDSVALFNQQAKAVQPRFEITEDNQAAVVKVCRRLDGLPLAIEIAAARIKMLPPEALLGRLEQSLKFLVSTAKDIPDRQQTLRGTIDWSYQLLGQQEKDLFARLGVFAGGFTLGSATEVCVSMDESQVFDGIESLLNNSLIRPVDSATDEPRFDMLQTIREFALEKAAGMDMLDDLKAAHTGYYSRLAGAGMDGGIYGPDSVLWMKIYEQEHDNYRQALSWALEHPDEGTQPMLVMLFQLSWFWYRRGYLQEGSEWVQKALEATDRMGESVARAFALGCRSMLALWSGELRLAAKCSKEAMEMGQRLNLDTVVSLAKMTHGTTLVNMGRDKEAYPHLVDSVELFDQQEQRWLKGTALVHLANVSLGMGNVEQALAWLETATPLLNATGDIWNMAFGLSNYGEVARVQGDYEQAERYYLRTDELYKQADSKGDQARLSTVLGYVAQHKGEFDEARGLFIRSLDEFRKLGNNRGIAECLAGLAGLAAEVGEPEWAAPLLSAAESHLKDLDGVWWPADRVEIERAKTRLEDALGKAQNALWERGQSMSLQKAIEYALAGW